MDMLMPPLSCAGYRSWPVKRELCGSLDHYLMTILKLENRGSITRVKDIADALGFQKGSVVCALKKLNKLGLIDYPPYRPVHLTDKGRRVAEYVSWRSGILVRFMMTVLHLEDHEARTLARNIASALEDVVIERMRRFMAETYSNLAEPFDV